MIFTKDTGIFMISNIFNWASRHGVSQTALSELFTITGIDRNTDPIDMSESAVSQRTVVAASKRGIRLSRNNVGVWMDDRGVPVRYGLWNQSVKMNQNMKSSDLIGITPVTITHDMVGQIVGVFTAYETKRGDWTYSGNRHEKAQLNFIMFVSSLGGIAKFVTCEADL